MFITIKTDDGIIKGKILFYCKVLKVSWQTFSNHLKTKNALWKYQSLANVMFDICREDECNDTYGRIRMYQTLKLKHPNGLHIPSQRTVYRVMEEIGLSHRPTRKPNGITKIRWFNQASFFIRKNSSKMYYRYYWNQSIQWQTLRFNYLWLLWFGYIKSLLWTQIWKLLFVRRR